MRKFYIFTTIILFSQFTFAQPANDDCTDAEVITVSSELTTVNFDINNAIPYNEAGCDGTISSYSDVWYSFTMPFDGNVEIDGSIIWNNFGATNNCNNSMMVCDTGGLVLKNLNANTNVLLRVFRPLATADELQYQSFTIRAFEKPVNDTCNASINIPLGILQENVSFQIAGSQINSNNGCSINTEEYGDIWYDFTMPHYGNLIIDGSNTWNKFEIYDSCGGTSLFCDENGLTAEGLEEGTNYKLRVYRSLSQVFTLNFLSFNILAVQTAVNDNCSTATELTLTNTPTYTPINVSGSTVESNIGCTSGVLNHMDVWFQFTLNGNGDVDISSGTVWNKFALYDACGGTLIDCFTQTGTFSSLTANTYFLRAYREEAFGASPAFANFDISTTAVLDIEDFLANEFKIYPNPVNNYLNMSVQNGVIINSIECYDLMGKQILKTDYKEQIDVSYLKSGIYLLKINTDKRSLTKKIMVQ